MIATEKMDALYNISKVEFSSIINPEIISAEEDVCNNVDSEFYE
jgi:hypothetical protein